MAPRFMERLERQSRACREVIRELPFDPPPYPSSRSMSSMSSLSLKSLPAPPPQYYEVNHAHGIGFDKAALPQDALILVVGASGWQGMHVVDQLLEHGYRVRGTVRNAEKAVWASKYFKDLYGVGRFTTAVIPDMVPPSAFDVAVQGCAGVVHCAAVNTFSADPTQVITASIAGALNVLHAASRERGLRRVVYCSSTAAAAAAPTPAGKPCDVTSQSWNMSAFRTAWQPPPYEPERAWAVYAASKLQSEQAVWRWYRDHRPNFVLNTVLPGMPWGRVLDPQHPHEPRHVAALRAIFDGDGARIAILPPQSFVDVQDAALLHVAALVLPDVREQRVFAAHTPYSVDGVRALCRAIYPTRPFGGDVASGTHTAMDGSRFVETGRAEELLRRMGKKGWTDLETSVMRNCEGFV